jgi:hypothetical protein
LERRGLTIFELENGQQAHSDKANTSLPPEAVRTISLVEYNPFISRLFLLV